MAVDVVRLRPATMADVSLLEHWDTQPHVKAAIGDDTGDDAGAHDWRAELALQGPVQQTLIAELDHRPLGLLQIIDPAEESTHYWGDVAAGLRAIDIWIGEAADLGRGHGTEMMRQALERCFEPPDVTAVLIDPLVSNVRAHRFYERLGFTPVGEQVFGTDRCLVHRLERSVWAVARTGGVR